MSLSMILCCSRSCVPGILLASLPQNVVRKPNSSRIAFSLKVPFSYWKNREQKSDAADILGVYIIYQIVDRSALSQWSQKELETLPCYPTTQRRKGVPWLWHRRLLAQRQTAAQWYILATKGFGVAERAKIVVA